MTSNLRAFIPCVNFDDFLRVTLPLNCRRFEEVVVVTSLDDHATPAVAEANGARVYRTDAFTRDGAYFNGARAIEEALDHCGRHGWICHMSADIVLPRVFPDAPLRIGCLYSARRRMLTQWPADVPDEREWAALPLHEKTDEGLSGYLLIWHASDPRLGQAPWQPVDWKHVGGSDSEFVARWPSQLQQRLRSDVLHLGPAGENWCGRVTPAADGTPFPRARDLSTAQESLLHRRRRLRREGKPFHDHERIRYLDAQGNLLLPAPFTSTITHESLATAARSYREARPFPHVVLDNWIDPAAIADLRALFDAANGWREYEDGKRATAKVKSRPFFAAMNSLEVLDVISGITGVRGLREDPTFRGGGLHAVRRGGRLGLHLDFTRHPDLPLKRRVNLLLYLNEHWDESWNGALTLTDREGCDVTIWPHSNRMVIFDYGPQSWHGFPEPLACPEEVERLSAAVYYYLPLDDAEHKSMPFRTTQYVE